MQRQGIEVLRPLGLLRKALAQTGRFPGIAVRQRPFIPTHRDGEIRTTSAKNNVSDDALCLDRRLSLDWGVMPKVTGLAGLSRREQSTWLVRRVCSTFMPGGSYTHPFEEIERRTDSISTRDELDVGSLASDAKESEQSVTQDVQTPVRRRRRLYPDGSVNATGRRKTAVAVVRLFPANVSPEETHLPEGRQVQNELRFRVNGRDVADYFPRIDHRLDIMRPFIVTGTEKKFHVHAFVRGGGITGQAEALRLSIARALEDSDPQLRGQLKPVGLLTRDPRMVERKKYGRHKARRAFQWVKR